MKSYCANTVENVCVYSYTGIPTKEWSMPCMPTMLIIRFLSQESSSSSHKYLKLEQLQKYIQLVLIQIQAIQTNTILP